ncbi:MAG: U32 family peptidase [Ruminococcaceae bacterium]|nr:U32 family peptidase [Oscillospiraceae bacterium]
MTELLSPAGNFEKMRAALRFGADAVYLAGQHFGMRSAADNFTEDELADAVRYVHERGKKIYLTVNTMPHGAEYPRLREYLRTLAPLGVDAVIVTDLGVLATVRELLPDTEVHISTQSSIVSPAAAKAWASLGAKRLVLARELNLEEVRAIREALDPSVELEAFVHGSMCVSYSGRCMLSNHFTGRDANRGACTQPCRWNYTIVEEKRPDERLPVIENENGTFVLSSKDMCMLRHIPELIGAGVSSFKIEGRMKSAYYTAVITNAYRMAIDAYLRDPVGYVFDEALYREVESVSHREYCTGYWFDDPKKNPQLCTDLGYIREKAYFATATGDQEIPAGLERCNEGGVLCRFMQRNKISRGDSAELLKPGRIGIPFTVTELYDGEGDPIESAPHPLMHFYARLPIAAQAGDILRAGDESSKRT